MNKTERPRINNSLNILKCISAFAVVCIHCFVIENGVSSNQLVDGLARFAVPVFFLISGFYSYYADNTKATQKYKARSIKLIKLIIFSNILYFMNFKIISSLINQNFQILINDILSHFSLNSIYKFLILNIQISSHLWFLGALLYCYLLLLVLIRIKFSPKRLYKYIPILLLVNIVFGEIYYTGICNMPNGYFRNFLFTGLPFFMLGYFIHDHEEQIIPKLSNKHISILLVIFVGFTILETSILNFTVDLNIGSIFIALLLFIWCIKNPNTLNLKIIGWIGGNLYAYIYILHPIVVGVLNDYSNLNLGYIMPIIVFIITTLISVVLYFMIKKTNQIGKY